MDNTPILNPTGLLNLSTGFPTPCFSFYRDKELWYVTEDGFEFPVPIDDVGNATFLHEDKAILFMRYIRKHIEYLDKAREEHEALRANMKDVGP